MISPRSVPYLAPTAYSELARPNADAIHPGADVTGKDLESTLGVMAGLVPAIHVCLFRGVRRKTWMPGTRPGMTEK
jgi:hypothetical protein